MLNAKSLLDSLVSGVGQVTGGQGVQGLADKAKEAWNNQSTLGKGAIAGGLLGVLLTQGGRRMLGTGLKIGGMAAIGGLAYKAYTDWQASRAADSATALPKPEMAEFHPEDETAANQLATHILQAMIAAAKADGHVTPEERARIDAEIGTLGLGDAATAMITAELDAPLDVARIAGLAGSPAEAAQIYTASMLAIDLDSDEEKAYLASLASAMKLDAGLVDKLHAEAARL